MQQRMQDAEASKPVPKTPDFGTGTYTDPGMFPDPTAGLDTLGTVTPGMGTPGEGTPGTITSPGLTPEQQAAKTKAECALILSLGQTYAKDPNRKADWQRKQNDFNTKKCTGNFPQFVSNYTRDPNVFGLANASCEVLYIQKQDTRYSPNVRLALTKEYEYRKCNYSPPTIITTANPTTIIQVYKDQRGATCKRTTTKYPPVKSSSGITTQRVPDIKIECGPGQ